MPPNARSPTACGRLGRRDLQAALVALDPQTGDVLAIVGGRDVNRFPFNRASQALRQPGSAFKPIVYAAALEHGLTPVDAAGRLARDRHSRRAGRGRVDARRDEHAEAAELTAREGFIQSNNAAAVVVQQRAGTGAVLRLADRLGVRDQPDVPSLALGTGLTSPLLLSAAYAAFANGGLSVRPRGIVRIVDGDGAETYASAPVRERALSEETAYQMVSLLRDAVARGTGTPALRFALGPVGGKTGTTNDFKDAWFVGFSSSLVAAVWVGLRPAGHDRRARLRRASSAADLGRLHEALGAHPPVQGVCAAAAGAGAGRTVQRDLSAARERLPHLRRVLQGRRRASEPRCATLHEGTFKQELQRAVVSALDKLRRRVFKWFHE